MQNNRSDDGFGRRSFLVGSAMGVAALTVGCSERKPAKAPSAAQALNAYQPTFFSPEEWAFALAICDRLIPADGEGPGALDAHVPVFIDKQLMTSYGKGGDWYMEGPFNAQAGKLFGYQLPFNLQTLYRKGIALTDKYTIATYGKSFADLTVAQRDVVIAALEKGSIDFAQFGEADLQSHYFFVRLLENTKEGYLSDPKYGGNWGMAAWVMINFPGARASYPEWVKALNATYPLAPVSLSGDRANLA